MNSARIVGGFSFYLHYHFIYKTTSVSIANGSDAYLLCPKALTFPLKKSIRKLKPEDIYEISVKDVVYVALLIMKLNIPISLFSLFHWLLSIKKLIRCLDFNGNKMQTQLKFLSKQCLHKSDFVTFHICFLNVKQLLITFHWKMIVTIFFVYLIQRLEKIIIR